MESKIYYWLERHRCKCKINEICGAIQKNIMHLNLLCTTETTKNSQMELLKQIETQKEFVKGMAYVFGIDLPSSYYTPLPHLMRMED